MKPSIYFQQASCAPDYIHYIISTYLFASIPFIILGGLPRYSWEGIWGVCGRLQNYSHTDEVQSHRHGLQEPCRCGDCGWLRGGGGSVCVCVCVCVDMIPTVPPNATSLPLPSFLPSSPPPPSLLHPSLPSSSLLFPFSPRCDHGYVGQWGSKDGHFELLPTHSWTTGSWECYTKLPLQCQQWEQESYQTKVSRR